MVDLNGVNKILEEIASSDSKFSPVTMDDYELFQSFFDKEEKHTYGNSWIYVTQGVYGIGPNNLGYKYYDGENLSMFALYPKIENPDISVFYWIRPMGSKVLDAIADYSKIFLEKYNCPTYVKKIHKDQFDYLQSKGFSDVSKFPWHTSAPMEDDTYPEVILDVEKTKQYVAEAGKQSRLHRSVQYYRKFNRDKTFRLELMKPEYKDYAIKVAKNFFIELEESGRNKDNISTVEDYYNVIDHSINKAIGNIVGFIVFNENVPVAFSVIGLQSNSYASLYVTLTLRKIGNRLSDYVMFYILDWLGERNYKHLNLGGSEKLSLHDFKMKFRSTNIQNMYWSIFQQ